MSSSKQFGRGHCPLLGPDTDERLEAPQYVDSEPSIRTTPRRPYTRACLNCGRLFRVSPSSKTRTCSSSCSRRHRSRKHLDVSNVWSDTAAARMAAERTGNLLRGTPAARVSRKAGPYESNVSAKHWIVIAPTGVRYEVQNLRLWCERNADRFVPHTWRAAYAGLRQVAAWLRGKRSRQVSQWRGWHLQDIPL